MDKYYVAGQHETYSEYRGPSSCGGLGSGNSVPGALLGHFVPEEGISTGDCPSRLGGLGANIMSCSVKIYCCYKTPINISESAKKGLVS
jgi:hypothetical protein